MRRQITTHHDGHGLNESLEVTSDEQDPNAGGSAHDYLVNTFGPFACRENAIILTKLEECLMWTKERAHARARRGVLGKNQK